jgi:DNA replication protein DnaC
MVVAKKWLSFLDKEELPEQEYDCPKHGKYTGIPVRLVSVDLIIDPLCPKCQEEDELEKAAAEQSRKAEEAERREEEAERRRVQSLTALNIGERNWECTFENFDAYTDELKHHLAIYRDFANNPRGRKLVMLGNNGTGKNHLVSSILKITGGTLYTIMEIEILLHQSYSGDTQEYNVIKGLCDAEMLAIDEIGRTKGGDWELNWLSHVVDQRHKNLMPFVLMSNNHLKENCPEGGGCKKCIEDRLGNDILSRIAEDGAVLSFTGEDYRYRIRAKAKKEL